MPRHRWEQVSSHRKKCENCGMIADKRPHPYRRQWWTEWSLGDRHWSTLRDDKTPPCNPN